MLKINYEFRKGIFFIRIFGNFQKEKYLKKEEYLEEIISTNKFTYIVLNTNYITKIDLEGINYLFQFCQKINNNQSHLVICDESKKFNKLLNNNFPNIKSELEVL